MRHPLFGAATWIAATAVFILVPFLGRWLWPTVSLSWLRAVGWFIGGLFLWPLMRTSQGVTEQNSPVTFARYVSALLFGAGVALMAERMLTTL
jgi:hypothetical protein